MKSHQNLQNRHIQAPVQILDCPAGHLWCRIFPRWDMLAARNGSIPDTMWCPEHQKEREEHRSKKISEARAVSSAQYAALPLPLTKRCNNPNPTKHRKNAVLPARMFYRRKGKLEGSQYLDSRCKYCRCEEAEARRKDTPNARHHEVQAAYRERRRQQREKLKREPDRQVPAGPFREWFAAFLKRTTYPIAVVARTSGVSDAVLARALEEDVQTVKISTVDRVGVNYGHSSLVNDLYPPDEAQQAA